MLSFQFDRINLPDSLRHGIAKASGFVDFSIMPSAGLALGTALRNRAHIYFDFNEAILTNTTLSTLYVPTLVPGLIDSAQVTGTKTRLAAAFSLHPNPARGRVEIATPQGGMLQIISAEGKVMLQQPLPAGSTQLGLAHLPQGLYLLRLNGQSQRLALE